MKNYLLILLVAVAVFGLSACVKGTVNKQNSVAHVSKQDEIGYDVSAAKANMPTKKSSTQPTTNGGNGGGAIGIVSPKQ